MIANKPDPNTYEVTANQHLKIQSVTSDNFEQVSMLNTGLNTAFCVKLFYSKSVETPSISIAVRIKNFQFIFKIK